MKKMLSLVMAITMCLSLAACSGGTTSQGESSQSPAASTPAASSSQGLNTILLALAIAAGMIVPMSMFQLVCRIRVWRAKKV